MRKQIKSIMTAILILACTAPIVLAHCQVPCGIYGDATRFSLMREHVTTIEKAMKQIQEISKEKKPNNNQLVRWVTNKESHANELSEIVTYYFMAQRVKQVPEDKKEEYAKYTRKVTLLHQILVQAMKAKQTTDLDHCKHLNTLIDQFEKLYNG